MPKLTETYVRKLPISDEGTQKHWDSEVKGLVMFIGKRAKTWYFQKDLYGQTKRVLIGRHPTISAEVARQTALTFTLEMSRGAGRQIQLGVPSLEVVLESYLARPKLRSKINQGNVRQQFDLHLKDWLKMPLNEITKSMVVRRHSDLANIPSGANHLLRAFRTVWNFARRTHDLSESPTNAIEWFDEKPDGRVISDLIAWRRQVDDILNPIHRTFYEIILYTGLRKSEALTLQWSNIYEDRIHLPMTKNGRSFDLPITLRHHALLMPLRGLGRDWVFPSPKSFEGYVTNPEKIDASPHAHRRTFATVAMEAGILEEIVGRLLNHTPLSITGHRYVRPSLDALRPAMQATCDELDRRTGGI